MKDTARVRLPRQIMDTLKTYAGLDICSQLCIEDVPHRVGQVIAYFPLENVSCTEFHLATIYAMVANSEDEANFISYKCKATFNDVFMCHMVDETEEIVVISSKQLACHLPCNVISTAIGNVVCFQASPIVLKE